MDSLETTIISLALIGIVVLTVFFVCHYFGPRATSWIRSNREEKIGLSKNKLFNANGYVIHSGSDFLLSSSGSFKRFDSIDRDYKQVGQSSVSSPAWNVPNDIPPQPLRPAPNIQHIMKQRSLDTITTTEIMKNFVTNTTSSPSVFTLQSTTISSTATTATSTKSTAIPRPITKRQMSAPIHVGNGNVIVDNNKTKINLSDAVTKIQQRQQQQFNHNTLLAKKNSIISKNPFLNGTLGSLPEHLDNLEQQQETFCDNETQSMTTITASNIHTNFNALDTLFKGQSDETILSIDIESDNDIENDVNMKFNNKRRPSTSLPPSATLSNPFTTFVLGAQDQKDRAQKFNGGFHENQSKNDDVDLINMKSPPKTDIDRKLFFDFEPGMIASMLIQDEHKEHRNKLSNSSQYFNSNTNITNTNNTAGSNNSNNSPTKKFNDFPSSNEVFDGIEKMLKHRNRNRSFSETEASEFDLKKFTRTASTYLKSTNTTNPFLDRNSGIYKTISEDYLSRNNSNQIWSFGSSKLKRQDSGYSLGRRNSSLGSLDSDRGSIDSINLQHAISCDSVSSESSVVLADLESPTPPITGYLCIGLHYDKNSVTDTGMDLIVTVMEAKELIGPPNVNTFDTFVRIYLVPDETEAMQTKLFKNSSTPSYNETFSFWLNKKRGRHSLWFHLYHSGTAHTLIGEAEMQITDVSRPITTWLPLSDSRQNNGKSGELMFSLSYLPTAERLTVVVVKGRNLKLVSASDNGRDNVLDLQNIFVKVYLLKNEKKVSKKRTSLKRNDRCPIFNESMIFSIPPYVLNSIQIRLTVMSCTDTKMTPIGHVIVGRSTSGKGLQHWHQMLSSLRKPVAMWHTIRQSSKGSKKNSLT